MAVCEADCAEKGYQRQLFQEKHQDRTFVRFFFSKKKALQKEMPSLAAALLKAATKHSSVSSSEAFFFSTTNGQTCEPMIAKVGCQILFIAYMDAGHKVDKGL